MAQNQCELQQQNDQLQQQIAELRRQLEQQQQQPLQQQQQQPIQVADVDDAAGQRNVHRVAVKLPPFWTDRPALWFAQADSQFIISQIRNEVTKYHYIVSQLDARVAAEVEDIITSPPLQNPYTFLREKLISRLSASEEKRVRQLISEEELGDRKPSQFLRHLRSLAGATIVQDNLLRQLWLQRLPSHVQGILASQSNLPLENLAELADKIIEVSPVLPVSVNAVQRDNGAESSLFSAIAELQKQVAELSTYRSRSRSRSRSSRRNNSYKSQAPIQENANSSEHLCWYHSKFQQNAKKCIKPCKFFGKQSKQSVRTASDCFSSTSRLLVVDKTSKHRFLVDTGSDLCCFPRRLLRDRRSPVNYDLCAANGSKIKTYGFLTLNLNLGLRRNFLWRFIVADVDLPIIGSDFLAHYHLLPDCCTKHIIDVSTGLKARGLSQCTSQSREG